MGRILRPRRYTVCPILSARAQNAGCSLRARAAVHRTGGARITRSIVYRRCTKCRNVLREVVRLDGRCAVPAAPGGLETGR